MQRMKSKISLCHSLFFLIVSFTLLSCNSCFSPKKKPIAKEGFLDLTGWDFEKDGLIELNGEWKFKWCKDSEAFSLPEYDDSDWDLFIVPGYWDESKGTSDGYCWLRLKIRLNYKKGLGLYLNSCHSAYDLFVNGKASIKNGKTGITRKTSIPQQMPMIDSLPVENTITIAWKISNFHVNLGGASFSPIIQILRDIKTDQFQKDLYNAIILGIILMMGLYHILLWFGRREDMASLYFSFFCLLMFFRSLAANNYIDRFFPQEYMFDIRMKIEFISMSLGWTIISNFLNRLFPREFHKKILRLSQISGILFTLFAIFTPLWIYAKALYYYQIVLIIFCIWIIVSIILANKNKRDGAITVLSGSIIFFITILYDIVASIVIFMMILISPIGLVFFIFVQSAVLSTRFVKAFRTAEYLSQNLQKEFDKKTRKLQKQKKELKEKDRLKTIFFQNLTHELRTPLTRILGPLESAINGFYGGITSELRKHLKIIINNVRTLLKQINQLLELARLEAGKMELHLKEVDLLKLLKYVAAAFKSLAVRRKMKLQVETNVEELSIYIDQEKTEKILQNLISNAFKFSDQGDSVIISLFIKESIEKQVNDKKVVKNNNKKEEIERKRFIEIRVKDTGCGIADKDIHRIFNRFQQGDGKDTGKYDGFGIGLSIVKDYVELHGGSIDVKSHPGEGAEFIVSLPFPKKPDIPEILEQKRVHIIHDKEDKVHVNNNRFQKGDQKGEEKDYDHKIESGQKERNQHKQPALFSKQHILPKVKRGKITTKKGPPYPELPVLVVDDNQEVLANYAEVLTFNGITNFILCKDSREVIPHIKKQPVSIILLDLAMPYISGQELLKEIKENYPEIEVIVVTGLNTLEDAVECTRYGAYDYMVKPVEINRLISNIKHCLEISRLGDDIKSVSSRIQSKHLINPDAFSNIITRDEKMFSLFRFIETIAESSFPVLITGESGAGKELLPPVIHNLSKKPGEFVTVNVAGLDDHLFSDTLFGHTRGAFTGAETDHRGLLEEARGGTIFLDEIGDLSPSSQVKLLRLLEEGQYRPIGADKVKISDARIIAGTNTDLKEKIKEGTFRNDLYHRLTYHIFVPPLRMRKTDIPLLVDHFLEMTAKSRNVKKPAVPSGLFNLLDTYHFPGNIRELEHMIKNAMSEFKSKMLSLKYFKKHIQENTELEKIPPGESESITSFFDFSHGFPTLEQVNDIIIDEALKKSKGNLTLAARLLDISPATMSRRMRKRKR